MKALNCYALGVGGAASTTDATSYATASFTPTAGRTTIIAFHGERAAGSIPDPTGSHAGNLTFTRRASISLPGGLGKLAVWTAPNGASPTAGAFTADYGATTMDGACHVMFEVDADVADIIVQSIAATGTATTSYTATLPGAFASLGNATLVIVSCDANTGSLRPEQGYGAPAASNAAVVPLPFRDATPQTIAFGFRSDNDAACVVTQGSANGAAFMMELRNPNAIQAGAFTLAGTVTSDGVTPISGATVRVIDRTTGDSKTTTSNGSGNWLLDVNHSDAGRYAVMAEYETGGDKFQALAPWSITAG